MTCREEFELWWENEQPFMAKWGIEKADAYYIWKSSRINMAVELPKKWDSRGGYCDYQSGRDKGINECSEILETQGIKVKS